ncbi:Excalibur domain protein [Mycobacterium sp. smrl_JER01]
MLAVAPAAGAGTGGLSTAPTSGLHGAPLPAQQEPCDPNYSGACVPIASDVDCAGGSGNGPAYVSGPVRVIGSDIYDLDRDGNGIACE